MDTGEHWKKLLISRTLSSRNSLGKRSNIRSENPLRTFFRNSVQDSLLNSLRSSSLVFCSNSFFGFYCSFSQNSSRDCSRNSSMNLSKFFFLEVCRCVFSPASDRPKMYSKILQKFLFMVPLEFLTEFHPQFLPLHFQIFRIHPEVSLRFPPEITHSYNFFSDLSPFFSKFLLRFL